MRARTSLCAALAILWTAAAAAQGLANGQRIERAEYDHLATQLNGLLDFEHSARLPEPGQHIDGLLIHPGITLGERFIGQTVTQQGNAPRNDQIDGTPNNLTVLPGPPRSNLAISHHNGFGSNALWGIGADLFPARSALGEGTIALHFHAPQHAFGFRVHADYPDPLGIRPLPGTLTIRIYDTHGHLLAQQVEHMTHGPMTFGYQTPDGAPRIGGILLIPADPGGMAFDDIIFARPDLLG